MKRGRLVCTVLFLAIGIFFLADDGDARIIKGKIQSYFPDMVATALSPDGSAVTVPVNVTRVDELATGQKVYTGSYAMDVATSSKVMMLFQKVRADGSLKPKNVLRYRANAGEKSKTRQFIVTAGATDIKLGMALLFSKLVKPAFNPLQMVDTDSDGTSDFDDTDDDDDGISDDVDDDADGDGDLDLDEDLDTDDDGSPDVVDSDDDDDGTDDHDDDDEIDDQDDDGISDSVDPDDDNDGIPDTQE